jgi:hypothetical protein
MSQGTKIVRLAAALPMGALLLWGATVINGDRSILGRWDASNSTATLPFQVGTAANRPAICATGQVYFTTDGVPGRRIHTCKAANTWTAIAYEQGTTAAMPPACVQGEIYFATDAAAGRNLYLCAASTWTQMASGGGGGGESPLTTKGDLYTYGTADTRLPAGADGAVLTADSSQPDGLRWDATGINPGMQKGVWFPWGAASYSPGGMFPAAGGSANRGWRFQFVLPARLESRAIHAYIDTAGTGTGGLQFGIYNHAMSSQLALATVAVGGGTPNINTTGSAQFVWSGGSLVSGGVLTLPAGVYWLVLTSDSTALKLASYGDGRTVAVANATTTTSPSASGTRFSYSTAPVSSGSGAALALAPDLSGVIWNAGATTCLPLVALAN